MIYRNAHYRNGGYDSAKKHKNNPQGDLGALRIISILIIIL